jgi:two-component system chemotaxis response regulator CheV
MDTVFDEVYKRTSLALSNQMEMLIFYLNDQQLYGINVFKIIEIIECPKTITRLPLSHQSIIGTVNFRDKAVVVIDLAAVLGMPPFRHKDVICYVVVCEYNNAVNGLLINNPDSLITRSWEDIKSPTGLLGQSAYLTAIAYTDKNETIQILDIEKILAEVIGIEDTLTAQMRNELQTKDVRSRHVLVVDDSLTARMSVKSVLDQAGIKCTVIESAVSAFQLIEDIYVKKNGGEGFSLVISDIEMPGMDGFTFARKLRLLPETAKMQIILHSSLSNPSNKAKAEQAGADGFIAKFQPDVLAKTIMEHLGG